LFPITPVSPPFAVFGPILRTVGGYPPTWRPVWQDPAYRERASGNRRDDAKYRWRHLPSGRVVTRTKREMREEFGLKADALSALAAGRNNTSQGWALEMKPRMPVGPRWIFP
jgi:hypothetical protein